MPAVSHAAAPDWYGIVSGCALAGISGNILWNCVVESSAADNYRLLLDETQSALFSPEHQQSIAEALSEFLDRSIQVEIRVGAVDEETPAARRRREREAAVAARHQLFHDDPGVCALVARFDAVVEPESLEITR